MNDHVGDAWFDLAGRPGLYWAAALAVCAASFVAGRLVSVDPHWVIIGSVLAAALASRRYSLAMHHTIVVTSRGVALLEACGSTKWFTHSPQEAPVGSEPMHELNTYLQQPGKQPIPNRILEVVEATASRCRSRVQDPVCRSATALTKQGTRPVEGRYPSVVLPAALAALLPLRMENVPRDYWTVFVPLWLAFCLLLFLATNMAAKMAGERAGRETIPPRSFKLDDVHLTVDALRGRSGTYNISSLVACRRRGLEAVFVFETAWASMPVWSPGTIGVWRELRRIAAMGPQPG